MNEAIASFFLETTQDIRIIGLVARIKIYPARLIIFKEVVARQQNNLIVPFLSSPVSSYKQNGQVFIS